MSENPIKISITGPDSSDKTALCKALSHHFKTYYVPDYSEEYLKMIDRPYQKTDLLNIGKGQLNSEREYTSMVEDIIFCDTCTLTKKLLSDFEYGEHSPWFDRVLKEQKYDYFFILPPQNDKKHSRDERFDFDQQNSFFEYLKSALKDMNQPFSVLSQGQKDIEKAKKILDGIKNAQ